MNIQGLLQELNVAAQARRYGIPLWQHPQFLFFVMGLLISASTIASWLLSRRFIPDPHIAALLIIVLALVLLVLAFVITRSFEKLAEASRLKSEFVSIVSHQLRSPLSNLKWAVEYLLSGRAGAVEPSQTDYFQMLKENSARMHELVNDLLMVSRIDMEGLHPNVKPFSFPAVLQEVLDDFKPYIVASNVKLNVELEKALPPVIADPSHTRDVLQNLIDNAVRYAWKGAVDGNKQESIIAVRAKRRGAYLYVEVEDNGVGIPPEDQKHIFEKFFRSANVLRHETQGSGLGLYIAKSLVEGAGGSMGFRSKEGKGSTFWFTIPLQS